MINEDNSLKMSKDKFAEQGKRIVEKVENTAKHTADKIGEQAKIYQHNVSDYIKHKPFQSISYAALAGLILGMIITR